MIGKWVRLIQSKVPRLIPPPSTVESGEGKGPLGEVLKLAPKGMSTI
jgi:hypothetical protein